LEILTEPEKYRCDTDSLTRFYDPDRVAQEYEKLFGKLVK